MNQLQNKYDDKVKDNRILLLGIIAAILIGMTGFGFGIKGIKEDILKKDIQINSMAEEIGQLKEENQYLYQNVLGSIQSSLNEVSKNEIPEYQISYKEQEEAIAELTQTTSPLQQTTVDYSSDVFTILILGTNENLTDTIILASINPSKETITLISFPRDLYVNGRKINSIYSAYGIGKIKQDLTKLSGLEIDKYVIFDFLAFKEVVDILGGIDVYVNKEINDPYFPAANNGYTEYSIDEGSHHMDGEQALMYARSRKTTNDFDRSKRQQQVIQAIRVKVKMLDLLSDIDKAKDLYGVVIKNIKTDIGVFEALDYLENYKNYAIESGNVISTDNFLYESKTVDGQYILLPKVVDYIDIKKAISVLINE
jgi:LCP family protein required for cell wall assembly